MTSLTPRITGYFLMLLCATASLIAPLTSHATEWTINPEQSSIRFTGTHTGNIFIGEFTQWNGNITFDPQALQDAHATITIDTTSATTGKELYDGTLPYADWFDTKNHPTATFQTTSILQRKTVDHFTIFGELTIKDQRVPVEFNATITINGEHAIFDASTTLNRLDFSIGSASDPTGDWVSLAIPLTLHLEATAVK